MVTIGGTIQQCLKLKLEALSDSALNLNQRHYPKVPQMVTIGGTIQQCLKLQFEALSKVPQIAIGGTNESVGNYYLEALFKLMVITN